MKKILKTICVVLLIMTCVLSITNYIVNRLQVNLFSGIIENMEIIQDINKQQFEIDKGIIEILGSGSYIETPDGTRKEY